MEICNTLAQQPCHVGTEAQGEKRPAPGADIDYPLIGQRLLAVFAYADVRGGHFGSELVGLYNRPAYRYAGEAYGECPRHHRYASVKAPPEPIGRNLRHMRANLPGTRPKRPL